MITRNDIHSNFPSRFESAGSKTVRPRHSNSVGQYGGATSTNFIERSLDQISSLARQKPLTVVVAGLAAGVIAGWFIKRKIS